MCITFIFGYIERIVTALSVLWKAAGSRSTSRINNRYLYRRFMKLRPTEHCIITKSWRNGLLNANSQAFGDKVIL